MTHMIWPIYLVTLGCWRLNISVRVESFSTWARFFYKIQSGRVLGIILLGLLMKYHFEHDLEGNIKLLSQIYLLHFLYIRLPFFRNVTFPSFPYYFWQFFFWKFSLESSSQMPNKYFRIRNFLRNLFRICTFFYKKF